MPNTVTPPAPQDHVKMPALFIPHGGGPCFFMDWPPPNIWAGMEHFLRSLAATCPRRPRAILLISGHWQAPRFTIGSSARPALIYDYFGFPQHTYELRYDAPGDPTLAARVRDCLTKEGIGAALDSVRGFDHGVFIPLKLVFPAADIPIVTLSLCEGLDPAAHIAAGRALSPLRDEDVLIIGSGMSFHNMRAYGDPRYREISDIFDTWLTAAIEEPDLEKRNEALTNWASAPQALQCHPRHHEEHLIPLMVVAGAGGRGSCIYKERVMETMISGFRFDD